MIDNFLTCAFAWSDAGAKEAHVVSPHFAQLLYFGLVSATALLPWHFTPGRVSDLFHWCRKNKTFSSLAMLIALGLSFVAVHLFRFLPEHLVCDLFALSINFSKSRTFRG